MAAGFRRVMEECAYSPSHSVGMITWFPSAASVFWLDAFYGCPVRVLFGLPW